MKLVLAFLSLVLEVPAPQDFCNSLKDPVPLLEEMRGYFPHNSMYITKVQHDLTE